MNTNSKLLFGKSNIERIVNIEIKNNNCFVTQELLNGDLNTIELPNYFWLLSNRQIDMDFIRLKGDLHYKWGKQYTDRKEFMQDRQQYKRYDTFSIYDEREACLVKDGFTFFKGMQPQEISLCATDIETTGLNPHAKDAKVLLITNTIRKQGKIERKLFCYDEFESEKEMLEHWSAFIRHCNPSMLLGHNIFGFDLHYLNERAKYHGIELVLGRDGSALQKSKYEKKFRVDGSRDLSYYDYRIYGREVIDTMHLAYKYDAYSRKYNSYGLKPIMKQEGWEKEGRQQYDGSKIRENYKDPIEWEKIKKYCMEDGDDCILLYDKMIPPFFYQAQSIAKPVQKIMQSASGSQLNSIMLRAYLQDGHSIPKADEVTNFEGAISIGVPGLYKNAVRFDFSAMYPSIMLQYQIYDKLKDPNNYLLKILDYLRTERLQNKKLAKETNEIYYKHLELSQKLMINSIYGFLSTNGLNFNYPKGASEVTRRGRELLQYCIKWATGKELNLNE